MPDFGADPTEEELAVIRTCPDPQAWFAAIKRLWWEPAWGWSETRTERVVTLELSTGGWSGNETLIEAMRANPLWEETWESTRRGGHFTFHYERT